MRLIKYRYSACRCDRCRSWCLRRRNVTDARRLLHEKVSVVYSTGSRFPVTCVKPFVSLYAVMCVCCLACAHRIVCALTWSVTHRPVMLNMSGVLNRPGVL